LKENLFSFLKFITKKKNSNKSFSESIVTVISFRRKKRLIDIKYLDNIFRKTGEFTFFPLIFRSKRSKNKVLINFNDYFFADKRKTSSKFQPFSNQLLEMKFRLKMFFEHII